MSCGFGAGLRHDLWRPPGRPSCAAIHNPDLACGVDGAPGEIPWDGDGDLQRRLRRRCVDHHEGGGSVRHGDDNGPGHWQRPATSTCASTASNSAGAVLSDGVIALALACAPAVHPTTMAARCAWSPVSTHSRTTSLAGGSLASRRNKEEVVATAKALVAAGYNFSLGAARVQALQPGSAWS